MKKITAINLLIFSILISCNAQLPTQSIVLDSKHVVLLLDSAEAGRHITMDTRDNYFNLVMPGEMSIQTKKALQPGADRKELLKDYVQFLKQDVESFTTEDSRFLKGVMEKIFKTSSEVSASIFPDTIYLIKTKGKHYGDGVYYTRDKCIVVPANELNARKTTPFTTTMYHELFHVYSRLNPAKRAKIYKLIGFDYVGYDKLDMADNLRQRLLFNPDGVDFGQKITMKMPDQSVVTAIPVIYANSLGFDPAKPEFFSYLEFNLYQITPSANGRWQVVTAADGITSAIKMEGANDFFAQIKDNTGYIIHPDEIMADNFSFIMVERNGTKVTQKFSPEGKKLLTDLEAILREP